MIEWYYVIGIVVYAVGFALLLVGHLALDGAFGRAEQGLLTGLMVALFWPVLAVGGLLSLIFSKR